MRLLPRLSLLAALCLSVAACGPGIEEGGPEDLPPEIECMQNSECGFGRVCLDFQCHALPDVRPPDPVGDLQDPPLCEKPPVVRFYDDVGDFAVVGGEIDLRAELIAEPGCVPFAFAWVMRAVPPSPVAPGELDGNAPKPGTGSTWDFPVLTHQAITPKAELSVRYDSSALADAFLLFIINVVDVEGRPATDSRFVVVKNFAPQPLPELPRE